MLRAPARSHLTATCAQCAGTHSRRLRPPLSLSKLNYLPNVPSSNIITLVVRISIYEWVGALLSPQQFTNKNYYSFSFFAWCDFWILGNNPPFEDYWQKYLLCTLLLNINVLLLYSFYLSIIHYLFFLIAAWFSLGKPIYPFAENVTCIGLI